MYASNVYAAFVESARLSGNSPAIRDGSYELSYRDLAEQSRLVARALIGAGIRSGDKVALWSVNRPEWIIAALGVQAAGAILVPIGTRLRGFEVAAVLERVNARLLFCDAKVGSFDLSLALEEFDLPCLERMVSLDQGQDGEGRMQTWDDFIAAGQAIGDEELDARIASIKPEDLLDILFTSGTTGLPKGVPMQHDQTLIAAALWQDEICRFERGDRFMVIFPFAHTGGYRTGWLMALLYGVCVIPIRTYEPEMLLEMIHRERPVYFPASPTTFESLLQHPHLGNFDLSCIRIAGTGGTDVPVDLIRRMRAELGVQNVTTGYGMTETGGSVTNCYPGDDNEVVALTAGRVLPGLEVKLLDADLQPVPVGTAGEIVVKGRQVLKGYYEDPVATAAAFTPDGFFRTGDIGVFDVDGNLRITGRLKDMYLVGGFNCYPAEIERMLRAIEGVADVAVIGVPDQRLGQVGRAFIVPTPGSALSEPEIIAWARQNMANYKVPRSVLFVDELPRNTQGKVLKAELQRYGESTTSA